MNQPAARPVPPGSSGVHELLLAITDTLTLPNPATTAGDYPDDIYDHQAGHVADVPS